jgi:glycosyltransferase involved in cell wall biosynthesis
MQFSIIVPVYNRPDEISDLLESLANQTFTDFEVLIVEDGSTKTCKNIARSFESRLTVSYYYKENSGQGFSRNYGFERANGNYFVVFDSDCIIPSHYFQSVSDLLENQKIDCWGGPDRSHPSFTITQKAISYSMTSWLTTGGIRGHRKHLGEYRPRSFNMGISKEVYQKTGGYKITRMGEDIEFSIRIRKNGFRTILIEDAYVYHKRRTNLFLFYKQIRFFGRARINIARFHPEELQWLHSMPAIFLTGFILSLVSFALSSGISTYLIYLYAVYALFLFLHSLLQKKNVLVAGTATLAAFIQLIAYGDGFIREGIKYIKGDK